MSGPPSRMERCPSLTALAINFLSVLPLLAKARLDMWVDFYARMIEDAEAKLQKAFELRSFNEVAKLRREIDNYRAMLERVK